MKEDTQIFVQANELIEIEAPIITSPEKYRVTIQGMDAILFNRCPDLGITKAEQKKQAKEDPIEIERNTWREKLYFDDNKQVFIPGENIHAAMEEGCRYWGRKIPGEGNKTYTDVIHSSVVVESLMLNITKDSDKIVPFGKMVNGNPSKGKKSGSKVYKIRPLLRPWEGKFVMSVFDARLTVFVLKTIISYAGAYKGLCDWRPRYGRFTLMDLQGV